MQYCFICDLNNEWSGEGWHNFITACSNDSDTDLLDRALPFARELIDKVLAERETLDARISACTHNWKLSRLAAVERNILRIAAAELANGKLAKNIIISEAIGLAKNFGSKDSSKFVNGVLDALAE